MVTFLASSRTASGGFQLSGFSICILIEIRDESVPARLRDLLLGVLYHPDSGTFYLVSFTIQTQGSSTWSPLPSRLRDLLLGVLYHPDSGTFYLESFTIQTQGPSTWSPLPSRLRDLLLGVLYHPDSGTFYLVSFTIQTQGPSTWCPVIVDKGNILFFPAFGCCMANTTFATIWSYLKQLDLGFFPLPSDDHKTCPHDMV